MDKNFILYAMLYTFNGYLKSTSLLKKIKSSIKISAFIMTRIEPFVFSFLKLVLFFKVGSFF